MCLLRRDKNVKEIHDETTQSSLFKNAIINSIDKETFHIFENL